MQIKKWHPLLAAAILPVLVIAGNAARKEAGKSADEEKTFQYDNGPDTIDVSQYPADQQSNYKVFVKKCSKCHTLARPINAPYSTQKEWADYIDKMKKKKRSGLDGKSAERVLQFLIHDSSVRKKTASEKRTIEEKESPEKKTTEGKPAQ